MIPLHVNRRSQRRASRY